jgi:hypothetical protein
VSFSGNPQAPRFPWRRTSPFSLRHLAGFAKHKLSAIGKIFDNPNRGGVA